MSSRCGLSPAIAVFEVGPGTGLATKRLLQFGVSKLRAIEPDPNLAAFLRQALLTDSLEVDESSFEDAILSAGSYDLGVAATSFHWLEQSSALSKVYQALIPSGWWAMWWTHFGSAEGKDPFQITTGHLFVETPRSPGVGKSGVPFALDRDARLADLRNAGFVDAAVEQWRWSRNYTTSHLLELYRTFSPVQSLTPLRQRQLLDSLASIVERQFGGEVRRTFLTVLYTARRPG